MISQARNQQPKWVLAPEPDQAAIASLAGQVDIPLNIVRILAGRGINSSEGINEFLFPDIKKLLPTLRIKVKLLP